MSKLISVHEIEEFSDIQTMPDSAITDTIIHNTRQLDEAGEMERFIREIVYDRNETPHGPTEIADILTTHVRLRGKKQVAAFVLKGKSFKRISSRDVVHQFAKLRQIPNLDLMVFGALGNIQDDAKRDFLQIAMDADCNYLIMDVHDLAKLFIAYEKLCPKDGLPFDDSGCCSKGHVKDDGLLLEWTIREEPEYMIWRLTDISVVGAKRYSAIIIIDKHYSRDVIRTIAVEATKKIKNSTYYQSDRAKNRWGTTPAHVVWLYLGSDIEDIRNANWVCRTCWIDEKLDKESRPIRLNGSEVHDSIEIFWNDSYKLFRKLFRRNTGTKEEFLEENQRILGALLDLAQTAIRYFEEYSKGNMSEERFVKEMQEMEPRVKRLFFQAGDIPVAPSDCHDYDMACQDLFGTIND
jgi:hypothetical protein